MKPDAQIPGPGASAVPAPPDVILVGDSHTLALHQGCESLGLNAAMLKSGGIHWNKGKIRVFAPRRRRSPFLPALNAQVAQLQVLLNTPDIFDGSAPVIASIGFHSGHLARAFGAHGHVAWPPSHALTAAGDDDDVTNALFASPAMLQAFIEEQRRVHFLLLTHIARRCKLTAILPPRAPKNETKPRFRHNIDALTDAISRHIESLGIDVYDPNDDFVEHDQLLPWGWVNDDGFHGTPEYGRIVMQRLIARGVLTPLADKTASQPEHDGPRAGT